jgi:hypothetical protein
MPEEVKTLYVESARNDNRIALAESDPRHPGGSVIVSKNTGPQKVGLTEFVLDRIREGELVEAKSMSSEQRKTADARADERAGVVPVEEVPMEAASARLSDTELEEAGMTRDEAERERMEAAEKDRVQRMRNETKDLEGRLPAARKAAEKSR